MGYVARVGDIVKSKTHQYQIIREINKGCFADAYKARRDDGTMIFLKQYKSPSKLVPWFDKYFEYETELNKRLREDPVLKSATIYANEMFLAKVYKDDGWHTWTRNECIFQAFPFITGNTHLGDMIEKGTKAFDWEKKVYACAVFAFALRKLHDADVVHCDLKPENVQMVPREGTKLGLIPRMIDMDRSILAAKDAPWRSGKNPEGYTGTPGYLSPEHLSGKKPTTASDCFTIGLILAELLCGIAPFGRFSAESPESYKRAVLAGGRFDHVRLMGTLGNSAEKAAQFATLIEACFDVDQGRRPTCVELHKAILELDRGATATTEEPLRPGGGAPPPVPFEPSAPVPPMPPPTSPKLSLVMTGDKGTATFRIPQGVGSMVLSGVVSNVRVFAKEQFRLEREGGDWFIMPCHNAPNLTAINDVELTERIKLHEGDTISAMGRASRKTASPLRVSFV